MLYNLLVPFSQDISLLNVFRYITFRSAGALIFALLFTIITGPWFLKKLTALKVGQPILSYVPEHQAKAGTPTMGGLLIMAGVIFSTLLWADLSNVYIWLTLLVFVGFGVVGFVDDYTKIRHHENKGLSPRAKMLGLIVVSVAAISLLLMEPRLFQPPFRALLQAVHARPRRVLRGLRRGGAHRLLERRQPHRRTRRPGHSGPRSCASWSMPSSFM